jgi:transcriptional regulator with XRE-family HTH domain
MSQTFGASLREARERKGVSLRQIAAATKISVAALESLERNDFSKLPGGIFSRAFVRSYAAEVGLDPDETVQRFQHEYTEEGPEGTTRQLGGAAPGAARRRDVAAPESDFENRRRVATVVLKLVGISVPVAAALLYFGSRLGTPVRQQHVGSDAGSAREASAPARSAPDVAPVAPLAVAPVSVPPTADPIAIEVAPTSDCWIRLTTDDDLTVSRIVRAGERERRTFRNVAALQVGDAAACTVLLNGRPTRPLGPPRTVREVRFTRDNYLAYLQ